MLEYTHSKLSAEAGIDLLRLLVTHPVVAHVETVSFLWLDGRPFGTAFEERYEEAVGLLECLERRNIVFRSSSEVRDVACPPFRLQARSDFAFSGMML